MSRTESFKASYSEYESGIKGEFIVLGPDRSVLYSSNHEIPSDGLHSDIGPNRNVTINGKTYIANGMKVGTTGLQVVNLIPKDMLGKYLRSLIVNMILLLVVTLALTIIVTILILKMFSRRVSVLIKHMGKVKQGDLTGKIPIRSQDDIGQLGMAFNDMVEKLREYIERVYSAEIESKERSFAPCNLRLTRTFSTTRWKA